MLADDNMSPLLHFYALNLLEAINNIVKMTMIIKPKLINRIPQLIILSLSFIVKINTILF